MKQINKIFKTFFATLSRLAHEACAILFPASYAKYVYKITTGKKLDLKNPKNFDEKNYWLRVHSDLSQWTKLADKYAVREYVKQCGLGDILTPLYGVWERAEDIDFNKLPDRFVLKTNHGFGKIILVPKKSQLDIKKTRKQLNQWLKERHGLVSFEPHYWNISRKIIAEEYLQDNSTTRLSSSLIDYKFYCINGNPEIIKVMYNRNLNNWKDVNQNEPGFKTFAVDLGWNLRPELVPESPKKVKDLSLPKPKLLDEMTDIAKTLSMPFPQVRVDLYEVNGKVFFGELTFTPGDKNRFTTEFSLELGKKMDLSLAKLRTKRFIV